MGRQCGGRFIQHQHARVQGEGFSDLDKLLLRHREPLHGCMGAKRNVQGGQQLIDLAVHALPVDAPETVPRMTAHEDIFGYIQVGKKHRLLVNHRDAQRLRLGG